MESQEQSEPGGTANSSQTNQQDPDKDKSDRMEDGKPKAK